MTRDDIERMAVEAGGWIPEWRGIWELSGDALERFAALVAAAEREACAKACESEAAKLGQSREALAIGVCAAAIRARGEI